jgi:hypothetical protein
MKELIRKLISAFVVMMFALMSTVGVTYAYWANVINAPTDEVATAEVLIGEGESVDTVLTVGDIGTGGTLVPVGYEDEPTTVNNEDKEFTVSWDGVGATGATGTLSVVVSSLSLGTLSEAEINSMFTIDVSATPTITAGTDLVYTVNVEFTNEPVDEAMYNEVANGTLTITLTFSVVPN